MDESSIHLNGLALPGALLRAIAEGRWRPPETVQIIRDVFGDEPDWPQFYDVATMARQNLLFHSESQADLEENVIGSSDGLGIDPALAVLIGSLGADMSIALDYRSGRDNPRVVYLAPGGWREVAPDFATLHQRLGL
jgi:hypothetical protein